ncbi:MAG: cyclic-di-AMP receptor [Erysipelotrichaceae bacterium]|nr:cyclic-di-AMP receptor [Erysipelotrichaceae bacterium]
MKLLIAMISPDDVNGACEALAKKRFLVSHIATTRAFLEVGTATLLISAKDDQVDEAIRILKDEAGVHHKSMDIYEGIQTIVEDGGGIVFVMDAEQVITL